MPRNKRRLNTGFGYIGFGNNHDVFNQRSNKAFSVIKEKLNVATHLHHQLNFLHKKLSQADKEAIKNKIRRAEKKKSIKIVSVTILLTIILSVVSYIYLLSPLLKAFKN